MREPGAIQKRLHRFFMLRPVTAFFAPLAHLIDRSILQLTGGNYTASALLGWNVVQLTTIGAKTRQPHTVPLVGVLDHEKIALVASSFGRKHNPSWYYNLKANSACHVRFKGRSRTYIAREAGGEEYERYWKMAVSFYEGYDTYKQRAAHRHIPVMVLEPET